MSSLTTEFYLLSAAKFYPSSASCFISRTSAAPSGAQFITTSGPQSWSTVHQFSPLPFTCPSLNPLHPRPALVASENPASTCWKLPGLIPRVERRESEPLLLGSVAPEHSQSPQGLPPTAASFLGVTKPFAAPASTDKLRSRSPPRARPPRPRRLTLVGLRQRVLPFQKYSNTFDPPRLAVAPAQTLAKGEEQHPGSFPCRQTPPPPPPPPKGPRGPPPSFPPPSLH